MLQLVQHRDIEALLNQGLEWLDGPQSLKGESKGEREGGDEREEEAEGEREEETEGGREEEVGGERVEDAEGEREEGVESERQEETEGEREEGAEGERDGGAEGPLSNETRSALKNRLLLARAMLADFSKDWDSYHCGAKPGWTDTLRYLDEVEKSHGLAKDASGTWSISVLRKLASSYAWSVSSACSRVTGRRRSTACW